MEPARPYRELTPAALIGGVLVGALLNMGIVFAGLQIGFTIVGSTVAAVLGFGLLRGILRRGSILEVNIFQTVASSVNTVNAGIIFTVPVLFLLGMEDRLDPVSLLLAATAGSLLGVVMIIPLRKQIIDYERLRFPEGTAVGAILRSPGEGVKKARLLLVGFGLSALLTVLTHTGVAPKYFDLGAVLGLPPLFKVAFAVGLLSLGAGYLAGRGGLVVLYGTLLNFWVLIPFCILLGWLPWEEIFSAGIPLVDADGTAVPAFGPDGEPLEALPAGTDVEGLGIGEIREISPEWSRHIVDAVDESIAKAAESNPEAVPPTPEERQAMIESAIAAKQSGRVDSFFDSYAHFTSRNVGIGMILGGAVAGVLLAAPALKAALASLRSGSSDGEREEVPLQVINLGSVIGLVLLFLSTKLAGGDAVSWGGAFLATLAGAAWLWLAGLVVAQTTGRTDWSPLSGLALIAIAIMMGILGTSDAAILPAVTVGAAICVATSMCADMMADLKTGYLVGSRPRRQQIAQIMTCWIGPAIALGTVIVLWKAYGFGPDQADLMYKRAVADGPAAVEAYERAGGSETTLAEGIPALGAPQAGALESAINIVQSGDVPLGKYLTGALIGLLVSLLVSPGIGVMVGLSLYLPFEYMAVFGIGGILSILIGRWKGAQWAEDNGVPLAAGLIVGDALVGVGFAFTEVLGSL